MNCILNNGHLQKSPLFGVFCVNSNRKPVIIKTNGENWESIISRRFFNEFQRKQLENNQNVRHVSDRSISFQPEFKVKAVKENLEGNGPMDIFKEAGFDVDIIGHKKPNQC
ncbi:hypothetical protein [Alkalihalobacillus sp. AL-G]|uniref:hypothetical protein n=1 Tax=Alkalihalobacillus sp. AL-G TaxID=2926399 RepID=UPI00272A0374|nr:hypothetical protein [Alkalihalobacillus sp. AL-G]WLD92656.1 hypothetical protein MOJ78_16800 [Alkalihalobacillus sp. AL-G]